MYMGYEWETLGLTPESQVTMDAAAAGRCCDWVSSRSGGVYVYIYMYIHIHTHIYVYVCKYMYTYKYIYVYIYTCIYIYV